MLTSSGPALVVGCGYLGRRVAASWTADGRQVLALTRRNADSLHSMGLKPLVGDVLEPQTLRGLPRVATVLYAVGLDRSAGATMREVYVQGLANVLDALPPPDRFIHISSTSVYGQTDGGWVEEASPTEPREESGLIVREAEDLLRSRAPGAVILRFAGIYGPNRLLRKQPLLKGEPYVGDADKWLNLIHAADGASAVLVAEASGLPGRTYNVADDAPVSRRAFYTRLAELLQAPAPRFDAPTAGALGAEANRRISNRAMRALGWSPAFPSYIEGLPHAVAETAR